MSEGDHHADSWLRVGLSRQAATDRGRRGGLTQFLPTSAFSSLQVAELERDRVDAETGAGVCDNHS